jgi:hypothetical protein
MIFVTTDAEHVVSEKPYVAYAISRAHRDPGDGWSAVYFGESEVDILPINDDGEAVFWASAGDAQAACELHRERMLAGDTAEQAAQWVRLCTPKDLEIDMGEVETCDR